MMMTEIAGEDQLFALMDLTVAELENGLTRGNTRFRSKFIGGIRRNLTTKTIEILNNQ